ncbi:MAG TPA: ATP-binding protein [Oscillatoriaceae cyanobacterium]
MTRPFDPSDAASQQLGLITQGSLSKGLEMRLQAHASVEDVRVGKFVVVEGRRNRFFSMLTDVSLGAANPQILLDPPASDDTFMSEVLTGIGTFGTVNLQPMLMLEKGEAEAEELRPVKTIPSHFSPVYEASEADFETVFGAEDDPHKVRFNIGRPLDMETPVCLDLERFIERSNGIFGKSGTGKSFLTRLVLCGVIKRKAAVNLIFDVHNEYGWQARSENKGQPTVKGLKQLFGNDVVVFTLDPESSSARGIRGAHPLELGLDQIEIEDLALLKDELNLSDAAVENALILREAFDHRWLTRFAAMTSADIDEFCENGKGHAGALKALQRKLIQIQNLKYVRPVVAHNYLEAILKYIDEGRHIVLEFGTQNSMLSYMLATNVITRRIHEHYVKVCDEYYADPLNRRPPNKLMITIEEAHKFLAPAIARQTIFGTIAREMRKYFVTLLIVDQRPSGIDNEVLSQVGTRITALLNDEKDIDAVFTGVSGGQNLRTVLAQLDPKQQALVLGYAVPMPVVVRTRAYDEAFYQAMMDGADFAANHDEKVKRGKKHIEALWG